MARGHVAEGADEPGEVLAGLGGADREAVASRAVRQQPRPHREGFRLGQLRHRGHAGAHDPHSFGGHGERLLHLAGHEGRVGVDPGTPPERPADQPGVGQRRAVAQLGVVERSEVVHRDHGAGATGGGDHEVGAVHDVYRPDEPLDRRGIETGPEGVQRAGGHRTLRRGHSGGESRPKHVPTAPADGEGADVETGTFGQSAKRPVAEHADPGGETEERRRIEGHAQACRGGASVPAYRAQVVIAPSMERIAPETYAASSEPR